MREPVAGSARAADAGPGLTIGTAGHIDHGKTKLIEALTGTDTDRLAEEQRRGISIELGFAELALPGGGRLGVIDVPGHERLVRTMVAGATGIDLFLLVVAADDGVMPQTREHLAVLRALGVERGVVAVTKVDAVDGERRARAREGAAGLVPEAPVVEVSARSGDGLDDLVAAIEQVAEGIERRTPSRDRPPMLHVDRAFTLRGIGTVVTGTLLSGEIGRGDRIEILPTGLEARVRSVQTHGSDRERVAAGRRVALALTGVDRTEVERGDVIAAPGAGIEPSYRLDVELRLEPGAGPVAGERVQVHHGTRDAPARTIALDDEGRFQLRLEAPLMARAGDRLVIRRIAPPDTLGGGTVTDAAPRRHGPGSAAEPARGDEVSMPPARTEQVRCAAVALDRRSLLILAVLERDDLEPRAPAAIAEALRVEPDLVVDDLERLVATGRAVRVRPGVYYSAGRLDAAGARVVEIARERGEVTLPELRDALGTSRKYSQALLEHLDATKVTVRRGDRHLLRRPR